MHLTAEQFNERHPIGTPVTAYPGARPEHGRQYDGAPNVPTLTTHTRSRAWNLGPEPVVMVDGYPGGIALDHIDLREQQ